MTKISKICAIGDSSMLGEYLSNPNQESWLSILGQRLNAEVVNDSANSASNYRNVFQLVKNLKENYDFYIIQWGPYSRYTFYKSDTNYEVNFNIHLEYGRWSNEKIYKDWGTVLYKHWHNELYAFKIFLQQIILVQSILKEHNKQYCMIHGPEQHLSRWLAPRDEFISKTKDLINFDIMNDKQILDEYEEIQYYSSLIDTSKFYKWNEFWVTQLPDVKLASGSHPSKESHQHLADLIYTHVQNQISNS